MGVNYEADDTTGAKLGIGVLDDAIFLPTVKLIPELGLVVTGVRGPLLSARLDCREIKPAAPTRCRVKPNLVTMPRDDAVVLR